MASEFQLAEIFSELTVRDSAFKSKIGSARSSIFSLNSLFGTMATAGTAAFAAIAAAALPAIKFAADFEAGITEVLKTTGILKGSAEFDELTKGIKALASTMAGVDSSELLDIAAVAGQLGVKAPADITAFTETIAKIAATTELTADEAARSMAQITNVMGLPITATENLGSVVNELSNNFNATAGAAKQFGLTADQTAAYAAAMKQGGVNTHIAGTSISRVMASMIENGDKFAQVLGMTTEEFIAFRKESPEAALRQFLTVISEMGEESQISALKFAKIGAPEHRKTILQLTNVLDSLGSAVDQAGTQMEEATSLTDEYAIFSETLWNQLKLLWNNVKLVAGGFGNLLIPFIKEANSTAIDLLQTVQGMDLSPLATGIGTVFEFIKDGFDTMMVLIRNWDVAWEIAKLQAQTALINVVERIKWFIENSGTMLNFFFRNWKEIFVTAADLALTVFINLGKNIRNLWQATVNFIQGKGFTFNFTPLLDGYRNYVKETLKLTELQLTNNDAAIAKLQQKIIDRELKRWEDMERSKTKTAMEEAGKRADAEASVVDAAEGKGKRKFKAPSDKDKTATAGILELARRVQEAAFQTTAKPVEEQQLKEQQKGNKIAGKSLDAISRLADHVRNNRQPARAG